MLAVLTTHPIQYQVPIWKALAQRGRVPVKVYYLSDQGLVARHDPGFGQAVAWDLDLLDGYDHTFARVAIGLNQASFWWLRLTENIVHRVRAEGATILWLQGWQVAAYWQAAWQSRGQKLEMWLRGDTNLRSTSRTIFPRAKGFLQSSFLQRFNKFLYVGEANRQFYLDRGIHESLLVPAPHCIENGRFAAQATTLRPRREEIRKSWSISENAFCVLFVGKLIKKKRPLDVVEAVARLACGTGKRPIHILFVGTGQLEDAVRGACNVVHDAFVGVRRMPRSLDKPVASFTGFLNQSQIAAAYVAADCLVLPSDETETWGLVVNEAMACGLPAIVSNAVGCSDDLVRPLRSDFCYPLGDTAALAACIESVMEGAPTVAELSERIERYDVLRTVDTVETLYQQNL